MAHPWQTAPSGASTLEGDVLGLPSVNGYGKSHGGQLDPDSTYDPHLHQGSLIRNIRLLVDAWTFSRQYEDAKKRSPGGFTDKQVQFIILTNPTRLEPSKNIPVVYGSASTAMVVQFTPDRPWTIFVRRKHLRDQVFSYEYNFSFELKITIGETVAEVYTLKFSSKGTTLLSSIAVRLVLDERKVATLLPPYEVGKPPYRPEIPKNVHATLDLKKDGMVLDQTTNSTWMRFVVQKINIHMTANMLIHIREARRATLHSS